MSTSIVSRIRNFFRDTVRELQQCIWPKGAELFESTMLVVVVMVILAFFVYVVDIVGSMIIQGITTGNWFVW